MPVGAAIAALLAAAGPSGLLVSNAAAQVARRPDDDRHAMDEPLLIVPSDEAAHYLDHSSHRSHASHQSHSSGGGGGGGWGGGGGGGGGGYPAPSPAPPPPSPPKPATVSFVVYPGGQIFVDGQLAGHDTTGTLTLKPGSHAIRIENRFLGTENRTIDIGEGETGVIEIAW